MRFFPFISGLYSIIQAPVYCFIVDRQKQLRLFDAFVPQRLDPIYNQKALDYISQIHLYIGDFTPMQSSNSYAAVRLPDESYVVIGPINFYGHNKRLSSKADGKAYGSDKSSSSEADISDKSSYSEADSPDKSEADAPDKSASSKSRELEQTVEQMKIRSVNLLCEMICQIVVRQELPAENESVIYDATEELIPKYIKSITKEIRLKATHNQYRYELATLDAIKNGDVEKVERSFSIPLKGKFGILFSDPLRSMKNHVHNLATLASRAAINSGILPERAFALSDKFFIASEECTTIAQCLELRILCAKSFAQMVKEYRMTKQQELNPLVRDIMLIISRELYNKFTVQDLAERLNLSYEHLERIFKMHSGLSLAAYIRQEKIKQAQELIRDTQDSIEDIAHILGFTSASHFAKVFKAQCGLTPSQYRKVFSSEHIG